MMQTSNRPLLRALLSAAALAALPLAGCSADPADGTNTTGAQVGKSLADVLSHADDMSSIRAAVAESGLEGVFEGPGSYTMLAPDDDAFAKLGARGSALMKPEEKAVLVAILRDHILPGHLDPDAIRTAIANKKGAVEMGTLGEGTVRFSLEGDAIAVEGTDKKKGHLAGEPLVARNGVILPVDTVLKDPPAEPAG